MTGLQAVPSVLLIGLLCYLTASFKRRLRRQRFERGRRLGKQCRSAAAAGGLRWGPFTLPTSAATQHFLAVGTTGSGKSHIQRLLMRDVLPGIQPGTNARALILDAKNDLPAFLKHVGTGCPVYTLNPFDARTEFPKSVAWDVAADVSSPARALNLAGAFIPAEAGGNNRYFTDAARQVAAGVIESFIRHAPGAWTFSDLVFATLSLERVKKILERDAEGEEVIANFLGDERTAYQVFTTVVSRMAYFKAVAAMWQRTTEKLSLKAWLMEDSILLLGVNATAKVALDAINEILFRIVVEEIDVQTDSATRRTWVWIDEARLSGPLLKGEMLPYLAVKGRSRGACLVLAFQDIEGFREAAGPRVAHEIIAQCSHKALLRMESEESAAWASRVLGQYETLEVMRSDPAFLGRGGTRSEHVARKDAVLPSEFYSIPP
ncbi:MAG: type IV secretion system DNA-binding domain-containing protein, partial [Planctomycetaceae bacterium]|nr:type IV secretion system DNA-binding domain-containing protein [Planctomycetaceae bacterium]